MTWKSAESRALVTRREAIHTAGKALAGMAWLATLPPLAGATTGLRLPQIMRPCAGSSARRENHIPCGGDLTPLRKGSAASVLENESQSTDPWRASFCRR